MGDWTAVVLIGLATMRLVEFLKEIVPWALQPWTKSFLAMVLGLMGAWLLGARLDWSSPSHLVVLGLGSAGLAALVHELQAVLSLLGDTFKVTVITRAAARRR